MGGFSAGFTIQPCPVSIMYREPVPPYSLVVNGERRTVEESADTPLLWVLRDSLGLTGTKFGCGRGLCGSCTVHLDGKSVRSCIVPLSKSASRAITTIEGLGSGEDHLVQQAWIEEDVPQCGYCQPGMIMSASSLLDRNHSPTDADINQALAGHICRCGTYPRIRRAIHRAAEAARKR